MAGKQKRFQPHHSHQFQEAKSLKSLEDTSVADAVRILSERNIMAAPVKKVDAGNSSDWRDRRRLALAPELLVLLEQWHLGKKELGKTPRQLLTTWGQDFYKVLLQEEPFKSTTVGSIVKSYRWSPFLPVATNSSMLSILLLLSKYRLRNVPVIEPGNPDIQNFITQSAIVQGLEGCKGRDWFDCIAAHPISNVGLPFVSADEVVSVQSDELILEAFKKMKDNEIGGLPIVEGPNKKIHTVMDFMNTVVSTTEGTGRVTPPITCKPDATLGSLVHVLASKSVHRIHVVNQSEEVVGVITLRDVISCFVYEPPNHFDNYFSFSTKEMLND
ncbi:hypothetical protein OIU85_007322 [Salix viminalis]|uniref:CBS domain-containing protein n=1 Tax=Salix viminalis TaxID=40686 RepID=A0A9Q0P8J9_SALVM|nr:hypothetical protein OIU85_007322 [Salix viminalis]